MALLNGQVLPLATFVVLLVIAILLAWTIGFIYARQQRFQDDLLVTFKRAGLGADITAGRHNRVATETQMANRLPASQPAPSSLASSRRAILRFPRLTFPRFSLPLFLKRVALTALVIGLGVGGYYGYTWSQTDVVGLSEEAGAIVEDLLHQIQGNTTQGPKVTPETSMPVSSRETDDAAGPYGPIVGQAQAAIGTSSNSQ